MSFLATHQLLSEDTGMRYIRFCSFLAAILAANWALAFDLEGSLADDSAKTTRQALRTWKNPWKEALVKQGLIDYSVPKPYRYAIPVIDLGSQDSKLMVTYTSPMSVNIDSSSNIGSSSGPKGVLFFAKIPID